MAEPVMAYLHPGGDGWEIYVMPPGVRGPADWPRVALPAGPGPDVAARELALAELGYMTVRSDHDLLGWEWCEIGPTRGVHLVGRAEVIPLDTRRQAP